MLLVSLQINKREIGTLKILNTVEPRGVLERNGKANYSYWIELEATNIVYKGTLTEYERQNGPWELVRMILQDIGSTTLQRLGKLEERK